MTRLSVEDLLSGRSICQDFKTETERILKTIDRLWLREESTSDDSSFQCFHSCHYIGVKHCIWFPSITSPIFVASDGTVSTKRKWFSSKELSMISSLLPNVRILRVDPLERYLFNYYLHDTEACLDFGKMFPNMECLIAPGEVKESQLLSGEKIKHLYVIALQPNSTTTETPCNLPSLESLHMIEGTTSYSDDYPPIPSKRFICERGSWISWERIPSSIQIFHTWVKFDAWMDYNEYTRQYRRTHPNLKSLGNLMLSVYSHPEKLKDFILDNQESITNLSVIFPESSNMKGATLRSFCECLSRIQTFSLTLDAFGNSLDSSILKILKEQLPTQAPSLRKLHVTLYCAKMSAIQGCLHHMPTNTTTLTMKFYENSILRKPEERTINKVVQLMGSGIIQEVIHKGLSRIHKKEIEKLLQCYSTSTAKKFGLVAEAEGSFEETSIVVRQKPPNSLETTSVLK